MTFDLDSEGAQEKVEEFFSHATNASRPCGVTPKHLTKVWRISPEDARRSIDTTTQTSVRTQDPTLSCNYGTTDIYRIISSWTHSLPQRNEDDQPEGTCVANFLLWTKVLYTSYQ